MAPFIPVSKPFEGDFYSIYEYLGTKHIHIFGYTYESSSNEFVTEDNPDGTYWANLEVCWFIFPLAEFIQNLRGDYNFVDDTNGRHLPGVEPIPGRPHHGAND